MFILGAFVFKLDPSSSNLDVFVFKRLNLISICFKLAYLSLNLVNLSLNLLHVYLCIEMHQQHTTGDNPTRPAPARPDEGILGGVGAPQEHQVVQEFDHQQNSLES